MCAKVLRTPRKAVRGMRRHRGVPTEYFLSTRCYVLVDAVSAVSLVVSPFRRQDS